LRASQKELEKAVTRVRDGSDRIMLVDLTLDVDSPFFWVKSIGLQGALLTQSLGHVDEFIASIVSRARISLGILVWCEGLRLRREVRRSVVERTLHYTAKCIEDCPRSKVLRWDEIDEMFLPFFLLPEGYLEKKQGGGQTQSVPSVICPKRQDHSLPNLLIEAVHDGVSLCGTLFLHVNISILCAGRLLELNLRHSATYAIFWML
jgi:hypothetical protein